MKVKEYLTDEQKCPEGEQWCPIQKKCVPAGSGKGKGPRRNEENLEERQSFGGSPMTREKELAQKYHMHEALFDLRGAIYDMNDFFIDLGDKQAMSEFKKLTQQFFKVEKYIKPHV